LVELKKINFAEHIHPHDKAMVLEKHNRRLRKEEFPGVYSFRIKTKAGSELWVEMNDVFIEWEGGPSTLNFIRDVTEAKELESQLYRRRRWKPLGRWLEGSLMTSTIFCLPF